MRMAPKNKLFEISKGGTEITKEGGNYFLYDGMALIGGPFQTLTTARREARRNDEMLFRNQRK